MNINLFLMLGGGVVTPTIQITTPAYLDPAKMRVGDVIGSAFTAGVYPDFQGNPVVETSVAYTVDGGSVLASYVLQAGDVVGAALVHLTAGAATRDYYAEPSTIIDFSYATSDLEWTVPPGGGAVPDAFVVGNWSIADAGTNGDATVTISTLPADNGSALTDLEYRIGVGAAQSWGAAATGTYGIGGLPDGTATDIQVRAINASGPGAWSDTKSVTTTGAPDAFTAGQWTVTDLATGGDARIAISALPAANGAALTDLERKVGAGAWTSLAGTTTGNYDVAGFTDGAATNVLIRAVNAKGNGADSDTKSVTTTAADVTAPTLTSPTDAANGATAATGSVSTDEGNGTLWWVVSTSGTAPTKAQVKAGQDHTGVAAADAGSQAVAATGVQTLSPAPSGLTASTAYTIHFMHEDAAANQSAVASGDGFTTAAASGISLVGWVTAFGNNDTNATLDLTALTGGSDTSPSTGDYVIIFGAASSGTDQDVTISDGTYTALGVDIYQSDTFKVNTNVFGKVQGATPDTSVSINGASNSTGGNSAVAVVLRGVNATTQMDVALVSTGALNTALADAPSITPSTAGAWIICGGGIAQDTSPGTFTGPANMTGYHQASAVGSSRGNVAWAAIKTDWASGAFNPDPLTGGNESTSFAYGAFALAVRPA